MDYATWLTETRSLAVTASSLDAGPFRLYYSALRTAARNMPRLERIRLIRDGLPMTVCWLRPVLDKLAHLTTLELHDIERFRFPVLRRRWEVSGAP